MSGGSIIYGDKFVVHLDDAGELQVGDRIEVTMDTQPTMVYRVVSRTLEVFRGGGETIRGWRIAVKLL